MTDKGASGKTIANKHGFLSSALNAAVRAGRIAANPAAGQSCQEPSGPTWSASPARSSPGCSTQSPSPGGPWSSSSSPPVPLGRGHGAASGDVDRAEGTVRITRAWKRDLCGRLRTRHAEDEAINPHRQRPLPVLDKLDYTGEWLFTNQADDPVRTMDSTIACGGLP